MASRPKSSPQTPGPSSALHVPMAQALRNSESLGSLLQRIQKSSERLRCISPLLPPQLRATVQAGPLDDEGWSLLVANAAAASKLRQMLPAMTSTLVDQGWPDVPIRLRIQPRR